MRVAYLFPWTTLGGGEVATVRLARALAEAEAPHGGDGPEVVPFAYCAAGGDAVREWCRASRMPTRQYEPGEFSYRHPLAYVQASLRLTRQLQADGIDIVHGSDLAAAYHGGVAARLAGLPFVCHIRSQFPDRWSRRRKLPIRTIDRFVFVSQATWRHFDTIWPVRAERGSVVYDWPPAVAPEPSIAPPRAIRDELGVPADAKVITMVARIAPQKDFVTLFAAFARLRTRRPDVHLLLVGDHDPDPAGERFAEECRRLAAPAAPHVTWCGFRTDVPALMDASDVVTLVSHGEGVPLVLLEAMARGRPVVATDVGGIPELIADGRTGWLHRPHDADHLAAQWQEVLAAGEQAAAIGDAGRAHVQRECAASRAVHVVRSMYRQLTGRPDESTERLAVAIS